MTTWGLVSTIKAPVRDVLNFAAWHLDLGAHRLFLHLDEPDARTFDLLKAHPRIRPVVTDDAYWSARGKPRPRKHQPRQTFNATATYARRTDVDWLAHVDVDEFLIPETSVERCLAALPPTCQTARMRPMEALAAGGDAEKDRHFKTLILDRPRRRAVTAEVWPTYGRYLNGGFLSHVAGKIFVRTGLPDPDFRIHNIYSGGVENPGQTELDGIALAHLHATDWDEWIAQYRYRHERGSYRAELKPDVPREQGGVTLHELFATLEAEDGIAGLRHFFEEVCAASPDHLGRLEPAGILRRVPLPLDEVREKHFPGAEE